ncbi:MAG: DUF4115 domain-containing protein [Burkholderiales bacterium]|nr:DUF4115 domain-containing protein [Burkholderiales bacterium]
MSEAGSNSLPGAVPLTENTENKPMLTVVQSAGAQLAAARLHAGLSVQQVAEQLKLSQRQIVSLESNQFDALPKMVIVRGFVRSYAKLLKLDADPVLACLPKDMDVHALDADLRPTLATPFLESRTPFLGRQDSNNRKYLIGAALLAISALIFVLLQKLEHSDYFGNMLSQSSSTKESAVATDVDIAKPLHAPAPLPASVSVAVASAQASDASNAEMLSTNKIDAAVQAEVATGPVASVPSVQTSSSTDSLNNSLRLKFRQDSWIQIKRENGSIVTSHLAKAGTEETFDVKEVLQIRIGNAAGVDGWLRGVSMDIAASKESNVINLSVK